MMEKLFIFLSLLVSSIHMGMETVKAQLTFDMNGWSSRFSFELFSVITDGLINIGLISSFWYAVERNLHNCSRQLLFIIMNIWALEYLLPTVIVLSDLTAYKSTLNISYSIWTMFVGVWLLFCLYR